MVFDYGSWLSILDCDVSQCSKTHVTGVSSVIATVGGVMPEVRSEAWRNDRRNHFCVCGSIGIYGRGWNFHKPELSIWFCDVCLVREKGV